MEHSEMINSKNPSNNISSENAPLASPGILKRYTKTLLNFSKNILTVKLLIYIMIVLFLVIFLITNYLYIKSDIGLKSNDNHFYRSILFYDKLVMRGDVNLVSIRFPPLVYLVSTCFYLVNGVSFEAARMSILFFSIIFLLAMFGIGYEMGGNFGGFTVMALAGSSPYILEYSRSYFLDFPQTALTALALYLLLKTNFFKDRKFSLLFGLVTALAMLTKWSAAFFLIVPVLWFIVPNIFRSFRSFKAFLIYLIPASIIIAGSAWYLKQINSTATLIFHQWAKYYFLFAVIPSIACIVVMLLLESRWKKEEDYYSSGRRAIVNFSLLSSIFAIIASSWFYWSGFSIRGMIPTYIYTDPRNISMNFTIMWEFILTMMNFAPFLLIIGTVFLFVKNKNIYRDIVIPISLILTSLLMLKLMYDLIRVIFPLVIFGAVLGGYWVGKIKNRQISMTIASLLIAISLLSITVPGKDIDQYSCFQFAPQKLDNYKPWKIFISTPQKDNELNFYPILKNLTYHEGDGWKDIAIYTSAGFPGDVNDLFVEAYSLGKKFTSKYCWQSDSPRIFQEHASLARSGKKQDFEHIDDILIIHRESENPDPMSSKILKIFFDGMPTQSKTYKLNKVWRITNIKIDRHQIWANKKFHRTPVPAKM